MTIDLDTIRTTGLLVVVGISALGLTAAVLIKRVVGKIIALGLAAMLVFLVAKQRQEVIDAANAVKDSACGTAITFIGVDVNLPESWCTPV